MSEIRSALKKYPINIFMYKHVLVGIKHSSPQQICELFTRWIASDVNKQFRHIKLIIIKVSFNFVMFCQFHFYNIQIYYEVFPPLIWKTFFIPYLFFSILFFSTFLEAVIWLLDLWKYFFFFLWLTLKSYCTKRLFVCR